MRALAGTRKAVVLQLGLGLGLGLGLAAGLAAGCRSRLSLARGDGGVNGRQLFVMVCAQCHGEGGRGDGPQGRLVGARDLVREEARRLPDAAIARQIRVGSGKMPSFGEVLGDEEVEALVREVRRLQGAEPRR